MTEVRKQMTEDKSKKVRGWEGQKVRIKSGQNIDDGRQRTEDWELRTELLKDEEGE
jgi:hypothetical protein